MDVRMIIISEFTKNLDRSGIPVTHRLLQAAESPFNLNCIQDVVDSDIEQKVKDLPIKGLRAELSKLEDQHEVRLRNLSKQYALNVIEVINEGKSLTAPTALDAQRGLSDSVAAKSYQQYLCACH